MAVNTHASVVCRGFTLFCCFHSTFGVQRWCERASENIIASHSFVTTTTENVDATYTCFSQTEERIDGRNNYADNLRFQNCLYITLILTLNNATFNGNTGMTTKLCYWQCEQILMTINLHARFIAINLSLFINEFLMQFDSCDHIEGCRYYPIYILYLHTRTFTAALFLRPVWTGLVIGLPSRPEVKQANL